MTLVFFFFKGIEFSLLSRSFATFLSSTDLWASGRKRFLIGIHSMINYTIKHKPPETINKTLTSHKIYVFSSISLFLVCSIE